MKKLFLCSVILAFVLSISSLTAPQTAAARDYGYDITSYHTDISIDEENTYHNTETITVDFHESRHGIYRYIQSRQNMVWKIDGASQTFSYHTPVKSVAVPGYDYETYQESGYTVIKIGDPSQYLKGKQVYTIAYDHLLGDDKLEDRDFVYYNLIGNNVNVTISNLTFSVTLPAGFDTGKIRFYAGSYGSTETADVDYQVSGNTVRGSLGTTLQPGEGLTIYIELPQGYFNVPPPFPWQPVLIIAAGIIAAISLLLFFLFGRDGRLVTPVEFYAPEGVTSAEAGYIIDTTVDDKDIISLIIYWASKGYLAIERIDKSDFKLSKLTDIPDEAHNYEKHMFNKLFEDRESVLTSDLKNSFYETIDITKSLVADKFTAKENRLYSSSSKALGRLVRFFAVLLVFFSLCAATYEDVYSLPGLAVVAALGTIIVFLPFIWLWRTQIRWQGLRRAKRSAMLIVNIIVMILLLIAYATYMGIQDMAWAGIAIACVTVLLNIIGGFMRKRTRRGSELLGRILGLKNFLERAEKSRIESLVEESPSYFYDVLPFSYVLGVSDKWAKKFEGIAMRPPNWYHDSYDQTVVFSPLIFQVALFHSMASMGSAMASRPAPQGGAAGPGGFGGGGGGFSGGGFGGGGVGSW